MARPSKYKEEFDRLAEVATSKAFTDKDLAELFEVNETTINGWKKRYPSFYQSLKKGKELADDYVQQALFFRAVGYSHPEIHISNYQGEITKTNIIKHYPPDPQCIFYWLGNRQPDNWKSVNRQIIETGGNFDDRLKEIAGAISKSDTNSG